MQLNLLVALLVTMATPTAAQCPQGPNVAGIVVGTIICTLVVAGVVYAVVYLLVIRKKKKKKEEQTAKHDVNNKGQAQSGQGHINAAYQSEGDLERGTYDVTDGTPLDYDTSENAEKGFGGYTPCREYRKVVSIQTPVSTWQRPRLEAATKETNGRPNGPGVFGQHPPMRTLHKTASRGSLDDANRNPEYEEVPLTSQDIIGLGFNICGSMRDGIYVSQVHNRGPASESGKIHTGDRIHRITISFENMVYEDALTILSYASPYPVMLLVQKVCDDHQESPQEVQVVNHPIYRSQSLDDLSNMSKDALQGNPLRPAQRNWSSMATRIRKPSQETIEAPEKNDSLRRWKADDVDPAGPSLVQLTSTPDGALNRRNSDFKAEPPVRSLEDSLSASYDATAANLSRDSSNDVTISSVTSTDTSTISNVGSLLTSQQSDSVSTVVLNQTEQEPAPATKSTSLDDVTAAATSSKEDNTSSSTDEPTVLQAEFSTPDFELGDLGMDLQDIKLKMDSVVDESTDDVAVAGDNVVKEDENANAVNDSMVVNVGDSMIVHPSEDTPLKEPPTYEEATDDSMRAVLQDYLSNAPPELMHQFGLQKDAVDDVTVTVDDVAQDDLKTPEMSRKAEGGVAFYVNTDELPDQYPPERPKGDPKGGIAYTVRLDENDMDLYPELLQAQVDVNKNMKSTATLPNNARSTQQSVHLDSSEA